MEPITSDNSTNFIERELVKRQKLNILWSTDYFIKVLASKRDLDKFANIISDNALKSDIFPLYVLLNIQYDNKDNKHSELIIITKYKDKYSIGFFDSNGPLSTKLKPDINTRKILEKLSINLETDSFYEFMEKKYPINIIGKGNCDAFCLWLIYINRKAENKSEVLENFNDFYKNIKNDNIKDFIINMNKSIVTMSKKR